MALRLTHLATWLVLAGLLGCSDPSRPSPASASASNVIELPGLTFQAPPMMDGLPKPLARNDAFRRGMVIGPLQAPENDEDFKRKHAQLLDRALALGVTDLQLVVRWLQVDYSATEIAPFESVHDELLSWLVDQARRRKMRVLLAPRIEVENEGLHSGAAIEPSNWEAWWWSYRRIALHYAKVASMRKVHALAIGSELSSTEAQAERWQKLIKEARKLYKGELTYLADAGDVDKVAFWDALDFVGVAIDQAQAKNEDQLAEKLAPLVKKLGKSKLTAGYVIAETGCGRGDPEPARELMCQYGLFSSFRDDVKLKGVYLQPSIGLWQRGDAPTAGSSQIVAHWYKQSR